MLAIESVTPGSPAADAGLEAGDLLLQINAGKINDLVDFYRALEADHLVVEVVRHDEVIVAEIDKLVDEDIGLEVEHPQPQQCGNQCVFCFVHQLPKGLRRSLYIKDEDYRFSYLYGSFITLTNLAEADLQRISTEKLSPLYISVHATDPVVRDRLLGCSTPAILPLLRRLVAADISLHCQIVLCPGINDGAVLEQSIRDLADLYPQVSSIAVVPVGLTRYRDRLPVVEPVSDIAAGACLEQLRLLQQQFLEQHGSRLVYAADELYLLARQSLPPLNDYDDLPQLENGVGLLAQFYLQAEEVLLEAESLELDAAVLVTGRSFFPDLQHFAARMSLRTDVAIEVIGIENHFFGTSVSVAGLVTGADLVSQLREKIKGRPLLIPDVMLKSDLELFLDDMSVAELRRELQVAVVVVESSAWGVLEGLESLADGPVDIIRC